MDCPKLESHKYIHIRKTRLDGQGDPLGIVQEIEIWPYEQMVYAQPRICPGERDAQNPLRFWNINE